MIPDLKKKKIGRPVTGFLLLTGRRLRYRGSPARRNWSPSPSTRRKKENFQVEKKIATRARFQVGRNLTQTTPTQICSCHRKIGWTQIARDSAHLARMLYEQSPKEIYSIPNGNSHIRISKIPDEQKTAMSRKIPMIQNPVRYTRIPFDSFRKHSHF